MTALIRCRPHGKGILDRNKGGLVLWLNDQMKSSSVWSDMSGRDNHGTVYGAGTPPAATPGALGYTFDGVDDYVNAGNAASLTTMGARTVSFWLKTNDNNGDIVSFGVSRGISIASSRIILVLNTGNYRYWNTQAYLDNIYHFYVLVLVGTSQTDISNSVLYVDNNIPTVYATIASNSPLAWEIHKIGYGGYTGYITGSIDEVRIFNRALSQGEITKLFNLNRGKFGV